MSQQGDLPVLAGASERFNMYLGAHATSSAGRELQHVTLQQAGVWIGCVLA